MVILWKNTSELVWLVIMTSRLTTPLGHGREATTVVHVRMNLRCSKWNGRNTQKVAGAGTTRTGRQAGERRFYRRSLWVNLASIGF